MHLRSIWTSALLVLVALIETSGSARAQCAEWSQEFALPGPNLPVYILELLDDGNGPALYAGGSFTKVDGFPANHVAKWDGFTWSALGAGIDGSVRAFTVYDDGSGPAIYAAGAFTTVGGASAANIAKWNGSTWTPLGLGTNGSVSALAVFDDGSGPALYAGGAFTRAGGATSRHIAKWNGSEWASLAGGTDGEVLAFEVWDDGSGPALFVGGSFVTGGGASAASIAKWDGASWSPLGSGIQSLGGVSSSVFTLAVFDDGSGEALYAGGVFDVAGGSIANHIAKWNGSSWSALAGGTGDPFFNSITVHDDGSGLALYACGYHGHIAKWDGSTWSHFQIPPLGGWHPVSVHTLTSFDDGSGPALYVGTDATASPGVIPRIFLGKWHNSAWSLVGRSHGVGGGGTCGISALLPYDLGTQPLLIAGGLFPMTGELRVNNVAAWDGTEWAALGSGLDGEVLTLAVLDRGPGPELYAGGTFTSAGGTSVNHIARWNGDDWADVGFGTDGVVRALTTFDNGSGPALYVGGHFTTAGGVNASSIARWDGSAWSPLGSGIQGWVYTITVFDDGSGPALYVGGDFTGAGGQGANNIAKWDGSSWSLLGEGANSAILTLAPFSDSSGPVLYAGGYFNSVGGTTASRIAKWTRSAWFALTNDNWGSDFCSSLAVFDDGSGPALYAGKCTPSGFGSSLWKWDGSVQVEVEYFSGEVAAVSALAVFKAATDSTADLYLGGNFLNAGATPSVGMARWTGCGHPGVDFCFGNGSSASCPCANNGSVGHGCDNSASTGGAFLDTSGWTSLNFDSLRLTSSGELPNSLSIFLQGNAEIAPTVYGDGLRCAGGTLKRLFVKNAVWGVVSAPHQGDPTISARSGALGDPLSIGSTRVYQVYYRDPSPTFCPEPLGNVWNASNAVRISWLP